SRAPGVLGRVRTALTGLLLVPALAASAEGQAGRRAAARSILDWPAVTREAKPWTRWWWLGSAVDEANLTREIAELDSAGFGGVEVTVIYGARGADSAYIPYLTPRWAAVVRHAAAEASRRGMGLDLPQGSGWRIGGPTVQPADANQSLAITIDTVNGGARWERDLAGRRIDAIVAVGDDGRRVRIPVPAAGAPRWQAPDGRWTVYAAGTRFSGDNVKRPAPGGEGPSIDPFSAAATERYLRMFAERTAAWPRGTIRSYFHDSFEYTGDGSAELFPFFAARRGYDLADELPALAGRGDTAHVARVQSDYRQTLDEMLREHFVSPLTRWSHGRGALMREQAHGSPGNLLDLYAASDIPETEIFGVIGSPDADPLINKFASSAAHVAGRRLASAEAFTWLGEHFTGTLAHMKQAADGMFLAGINHLFYHGTAYSPSTAAWPGWQFYASMDLNARNAIWRDLPAFNRYVARVQSSMQEGIADADVLLYWPIWDNWHDASRRRMDFRVHDPVWFNDRPFGKLARALHLGGVGVDYVSDRQLAADVSIAAGHLRSAGGRWSAVVVPNAVHIPPATFTRLLALARSGATVAFLGPIPSDVPGAARLSARRAELGAAQRTLVWRDSGGLRIARLGRGRVLAGDAVEPLLAAAGVRRDALGDRTGLRFVRRLVGDERRYFVVAGAAVNRWIDVDGSPAAVALLDPVTGRTGLARLRTANGRTQALVQLDAGHSLIVRASPRAVRGEPWRYGRADGPLAEVRGRWTVTFLDGGPVVPKPFSSDSLVPWTGRGDDDADRFAGTARYSLTFDAPDSASRHLLTLGAVHETARVRLNGRELGVLFEPPYSIEVGPLRRAGNVLEVEVTNLSANRVRDLDRRGVQWRIFRDINFVGIDYRPFDASRWPVRPSGLLGPVALQPLSDEVTR
ncbi:MAG TPA: glycosyl hydrolase, partial [Gemmatimonadaceae bacterium]|nr:glycosyl hydrolase [Gemmatimonadaceae bacterium]